MIVFNDEMREVVKFLEANVQESRDENDKPYLRKIIYLYS